MTARQLPPSSAEAASPTPSLDVRAHALSFGAGVDDYDRLRPPLPDATISRILGGDELFDVLDVGAGTGVVSARLVAHGASVVAVEPDRRMAERARSRGVDVEISDFEDWDSRGATFDIVTFVNSWHWVDPAVSLPKVRALLRPTGTLALVWLASMLDDDARQRQVDAIMGRWFAGGAPGDGAGQWFSSVQDALSHFGWSVRSAHDLTWHHYTRDQWLDLMFTFSAPSLLVGPDRSQLRRELADVVGEAVTVRGRAVSVIATR